jgi:hypothetical protein
MGFEWFQRWPGGYRDSATYDALWDEALATDKGLKCSVASALRFKKIMAAPPANIAVLLAESSWEGRFWNWNDDYSDPTSYYPPSNARLWAWAYYLIKWISVSHNDGSCDLPTLEMLEELLVDCIATARASGGSIQGCSARWDI